MLALIEPLARGFDQRSFQCQTCDFAETLVVNFRLAASAPALAPPDPPSARAGVLATGPEAGGTAQGVRAVVGNLGPSNAKRQANG